MFDQRASSNSSTTLKLFSASGPLYLQLPRLCTLLPVLGLIIYVVIALSKIYLPLPPHHHIYHLYYPQCPVYPKGMRDSLHFLVLCPHLQSGQMARLSLRLDSLLGLHSFPVYHGFLVCFVLLAMWKIKPRASPC